MLKDIAAATPLENHQIRIRFEDGVEGIVSLACSISFQGVFAPLRDPEYFGLVRVDSGLGTVTWPDGADLDPDVLYSLVTGEPIAVSSA